MSTLKVEWRTCLRMDDRRTPRQRVAYWLRRLATRIDGQRTLSLAVETTPPLPEHVLEAGLQHAMDDLYKYVSTEAKHAASDRLLRFTRPELFADEK